MNGRFVRMIAAAAILVGLAGTAHARQVLTTTPVDLDFYGWTMACNAVNASDATLEVATRFCDFQGNVVSATPFLALAPGEATSHPAPLGKYVYYCRFAVRSGLGSGVRAMAVISKNGRYQTTTEAR
jgi:hypothetical protein